jgi:hypothetical protein
MVPPCQATFHSIQNLPIADGSGHFATMYVPGQCPMPTCPVYPPTGVTSLIAGHISLLQGGLTTPIECRDEMVQWKEVQHMKECANVVVTDGELTVAKLLEMEFTMVQTTYPRPVH